MCFLLWIPINLSCLHLQNLSVFYGLIKQNERLKTYGWMVSDCLRTDKVHSMPRFCWLWEFKVILTWVFRRLSYSLISTAWGNCCGIARGWQLSGLSKSYFLVVQDYFAFKRTISIHVQGIRIEKQQRWLCKEVFGGTTGKMWGGDKRCLLLKGKKKKIQT